MLVLAAGQVSVFGPHSYLSEVRICAVGPEGVVVAQAVMGPNERTCYYYLWQHDKMGSLAGGYPTVDLPLGGALPVGDVELSYERLVLLDEFPFVARGLAVVVLVAVVDNPNRYLIR